MACWESRPLVSPKKADHSLFRSCEFYELIRSKHVRFHGSGYRHKNQSLEQNVANLFPKAFVYWLLLFLTERTDQWSSMRPYPEQSRGGEMGRRFKQIVPLSGCTHAEWARSRNTAKLADLWILAETKDNWSKSDSANN